MNKFEHTLVHISDPHFGTEDEALVHNLIRDVNEISPSLIILSGDLTQRAFKKQFLQARELIEKLEAPVLVIPGNHDIPLFNLFERFTNPFKRYHKYISDELYPEFNSDGLSVVGVNTSTPFRSQKGRIRETDIEYLHNYFSKIPKENIKGVVVHHNAFPFEGLKGNSALDNTNKFLREMNRCGVDLVFAGHLHRSIIHTFHEAKLENNLLMLQAGTSLSSRLRKEDNTFLTVKTKLKEITVGFRVFNDGKFREVNSKTFNRTTTGDCGTNE